MPVCDIISYLSYPLPLPPPVLSPPPPVLSLQLVKRNVMENVVPIVIAAKHLFEKERDPLLKDLLLYLKELMQVS